MTQLDERLARGRAAANATPLAAHGIWEAPPDRPDPVSLLEAQDATREPDLVPVRHGRMLVSPFTFYRGTAKIMASDLAGTPVSGLDAQLCGDAHLSNFGLFASPERTLLFDLNDFDETLPGPFEYDVKRMAASFLIAGRNNEFSHADALAVAVESAAAYREAMAEFARMRTMDVWYARLDESELRNAVEGEESTKDKKVRKEFKAAEKTATKTAAKARTRDSTQALAKLGELVDGRYRIVSKPPLIVPERELKALYGFGPETVTAVVNEQFKAYRETLPDDRRQLLDRFRIVDTARKVVGVGSVGTRAFIVLLQGRDADDPLFLQIKEAMASVLEDHLPPSRYPRHGERVVRGQRMMQAASDIFLGWTTGLDVNRHYYWRQLRDMKGSAIIENMVPFGMSLYARICGWTLARAHARSGDPVAIAAYLGTSDAFDKAIGTFSRAYADQTEHDYRAFSAAIASGRLQAVEGI
ncbi:DUF2252 domain-containing protein [Amycolatopsis sp. GM8]|uniref:DUF2252 domain-containing protein n=1 Tax=Amycolatopsis sp. GM8 TaxID=2896530 RepID=UPI001F244665|nr:DUF2252 domain-containing protein [Amycolatopsis sp. GM8]